MKDIFLKFIKQLSGLSIFFVLIISNSFGQDTAKCNDKYFNDQLLDKLVGNWDLKGIIGNRPVANNLSAQWVLKHQFIELNFIDIAKIPSYEAKVFIGYDCISERYVVHWIDNFGGRFSETLGYGQQKRNFIDLRFEYPDGPFLCKFIYEST